MDSFQVVLLVFICAGIYAGSNLWRPGLKTYKVPLHPLTLVFFLAFPAISNTSACSCLWSRFSAKANFSCLSISSESSFTKKLFHGSCLTLSRTSRGVTAQAKPFLASFSKSSHTPCSCLLWSLLWKTGANRCLCNEDPAVRRPPQTEAQHSGPVGKGITV